MKTTTKPSSGIFLLLVVSVLSGEVTNQSSPVLVGRTSRAGGGSGGGVVRSERQVFPGSGEACGFGQAGSLDLCDWAHSNLSSLHFALSSGLNANWLGGPPEDGSDDKEGGYVVFETSQIPNISGRTSQSAVLEGPLLSPSMADGSCLSFKYALDGLSPEKLRVLLHPVTHPPGGRYIFDGTSLSRENEHAADVVLWETRDSTDGVWRTAEVVYTSPHPHQIYLEGIPRDGAQLTRRFRGYIAIDSVMLKTATTCPGHCNFDGGFCDWTNEREDDDFDWKLGRGSQNPSTGPVMDRASYTHGGNSGGYAYISSEFPRRSGDRARISSREFSSTKGDEPLCMRFWTHMFGNGIGTLRVLLHDVESGEERAAWQLSGEAGNAWYQGQVPISSFTSFKILFEGEVGRNNLGDIAIDDISFSPGPCPSAPQTAAGLSGDCTFEIDECGWANVAGRTDEMDWERRLGSNARTPISDHTLGAATGNFMTLSGVSVQRAGDRAWMMSPVINGSSKPKCLSFWYHMYEPFIDSGGPSLGGLKVYTVAAPGSSVQNDIGSFHPPVMTPIWRLYNQQAPVWKYAQARIMEQELFQVVFEGVSGSSRANGFVAIDDIAFFEGDCTTVPMSGYVNAGECSFEKDLCTWRNTSSDRSFRWEMATITRRPANLPDKTFGAPVGYVYFDIFSQTQSPPVRLVSAMPSTGDRVCFSFWYAAFGNGETTQLRVLVGEGSSSNQKEPSAGDSAAEGGRQVWKLTAAHLNTARPEWKPAQVALDGSRPLTIILEGMASNGGFAVDDISFHPGDCAARPKEAASA
ncbi:MAM and LDL-receptor class A domain-containing protein 1 isoform X2 [Folsomia candida]|uniref:MAM and LDL-receptor class A domain-containing protein 1 isoform X2 n=1 Tax=Folsomia candida TaxID=158441 RepID=UPI000B8FBFC7|nr:MAM and LDL-receptor class A domain-containing protein 1 isoform X2 [Folsomia candida]